MSWEFEDIYSQRIVAPYSELDLCAIVVIHLENAYQNIVYLTNLEEKSSVVCVSFTKTSDYFGFKEVLRVGSIVAALNLKFVRKLEKSKYPCLTATENSVFTQKVAAHKHLLSKSSSLEERAKQMVRKKRVHI